ncbi:XopAU family type III secretion system effector serine/threonine kinase [Paracidovorax avenae]
MAGLPPLSIPSVRPAREGEGSANPEADPPGPPRLPGPQSLAHVPLLARRRGLFGEGPSAEGAPRLTPLDALRRASTFVIARSPSSFDHGGRSGARRAGPSHGAGSSQPSSLASLLDPSTPIARDRDGTCWSPVRALRRERRMQAELRASSGAGVLSPHVVHSMGSPPGWEARLAALRSGAAEVRQGFERVDLDAGWEAPDAAGPAWQRIGGGASGEVYAVRLARNFMQGGEDHGRDFVFKAMLSLDPADRLPPRLHAQPQEDGEALRQAIEAHKDRIHQEFQVAIALRGTSQVMQVRGLVQIGNRLGILSEWIDGAPAGELIGEAPYALEDGDVTAPAHLEMARTMIADVLIALARFHDEGVVHQDISHNNVMYDRQRGMFRLLDMGQGGESGGPRAQGTPGYMDMHAARADHRSDVYAAAQLLVRLLRSPGYRPGMVGMSGSRTVESFPFAPALRALAPDRLDAAVRFINRMIGQQLDARSTAEELLGDPFLQGLEPRVQTRATVERVLNPEAPPR